MIRFLNIKFAGSPEVTRIRADLVRAYRPVYSSEVSKNPGAVTMVEFTDIPGKHYVSNLTADELDEVLDEIRESVLAQGV